VLEYDDVMNQQREVVYEYRDRILEGEDISDTARLQIGQTIERMGEEYLVGEFAEEWDLTGLFTQLEQLYPVAIGIEDLDPNALEKSALIADLREDVIKAYNEREEELGSDLMRALERFVLLQIIDDRWREHLHDMDYLREGIHLRGFAQIDPLVAYKNEGFDMFTSLMNAIWEEFARYIFHVDVQVEGEDPAAAVPTGNGAANRRARALEYSGGGAEDQPSALAAARAQAVTAGAGGVASAYPDMDTDLGEPILPGSEGDVVRTMEPRRLDEHEQIGRNDPCWCGSGRKFKRCHGA